MTDEPIDTHGMLIDFGKHRGERYTRAPISYLRWMVNKDHSRADVAKAELARRGVPLHDRAVEISSHAIDSASNRLLSTWRKLRTGPANEGLHAWLYRFCEDALNHHKPDEQGRITYKGVRLVFEPGALYPVLKTCMPAKNCGKNSRDMRHYDDVDNEENHHEHDTEND